MSVAMDFDGGYYLIRQSLMPSGHLYKHTAADSSNVPELVVEAVNAIQATPWMVNTYIRDVVREAWLSGAQIGPMPSPDDTPIPPAFEDDTWERMTNKERATHRMMLAEIRRDNGRLAGRRESLLRKMDLADRYERETIWYPHFVDFRTRVYPYGQDLNPQADTIGRAMLQFGNGKPLGPRGRYWLGVSAAGHFGHDKLPFDERAAWTEENFDAIKDSVERPFDGARLWMDADSPFEFLAVAREYVMSKSEPTEFISHQPIPMDGSCNGLQLLSLAGRDSVGAMATNCTSDPVRQDLYTEVAKTINDAVDADARAAIPEAIEWAGSVERKTVKRAVMTTPYGVTPRGIRMQLLEDGLCSGFKEAPHRMAEYMKDKIVDAMEQVCQKPKAIMAYFQTLGETLADEEHPLKWDAPNGATIVQDYPNWRTHKIRTLSGTFDLQVMDGKGGIDRKKQSLGSAPNIVHSWDAAMLHRCVITMQGDGIDDFAMVHDSYGVHPCHVDQMHRHIRTTAYNIFSRPVLAEFHKSVQSYAPGVDLPSPPPLGDFNIKEVLNAPFFFS